MARPTFDADGTVDLIYRIDLMLDFLVVEDCMDRVVRMGHTPENAFLFTRAAEVLRKAREDDARRYAPVERP